MSFCVQSSILFPLVLNPAFSATRLSCQVLSKVFDKRFCLAGPNCRVLNFVIVSYNYRAKSYCYYELQSRAIDIEGHRCPSDGPTFVQGPSKPRDEASGRFLRANERHLLDFCRRPIPKPIPVDPRNLRNQATTTERPAVTQGVGQRQHVPASGTQFAGDGAHRSVRLSEATLRKGPE